MIPATARGRATWIVLPARDERDHIVDALRGIEQAAATAPGPVHVVVVDDGSTDETAALAAKALACWPGRHVVLDGPAEGVGWARRFGIEHALAAIGDEEALVATTDADSRV
ncbi:MAG: glycosyltransferase, partial [Solirubrobacteraceae bacterium]|nr:glycosyltransferase [Solirubrobacteraceae bacterium]